MGVVDSKLQRSWDVMYVQNCTPWRSHWRGSTAV